MPRFRSLSESEGQRWYFRPGFLLVNLAVFAVAAWGLSGEYLRHERLETEISRLKAEGDRLEEENRETARLAQIFADDEAVEREARLKLGLRKPGESVIILKETETEIAEIPAPDGVLPLSDGSFGGNLRLWWRYLSGPEG